MFVLFETGQPQDMLARARWDFPEPQQPIIDTHLIVEIMDCAVRSDTLHRFDREHRIGEVNSVHPPQEIES